jgi:enoyl-CoA hydratase/carnithine racemase
MYETVNLEIRDGAAWIELNRPEALNAWNTQLGRDLHDAVHAVAADDEARVVVLTGAGRAFSSGADLKAGFEPRGDGKPDVHTRLTQTYHPIMTTIRRMPKPVIAAVNGPAVGIGCSLPLSCDLVVAAESAYFLLAFVNIGLVPDGGSSLFIPARAGFTRAARRSPPSRPSAGTSSTGSIPTASSAARSRRWPAGSPRARPGPMRGPSASSTAGSSRGWTTSSGWKPTSSRRWPLRTTSWKA